MLRDVDEGLEDDLIKLLLSAHSSLVLVYECSPLFILHAVRLGACCLSLLVHDGEYLVAVTRAKFLAELAL